MSAFRNLYCIRNLPRRQSKAAIGKDFAGKRILPPLFFQKRPAGYELFLTKVAIFRYNKGKRGFAVFKALRNKRGSLIVFC